MSNEPNKELELISMVEKMQLEQREYFRMKAKFGNATQQLAVCKELEKELSKYCAARRKELEGIQKTLF